MRWVWRLWGGRKGWRINISSKETMHLHVWKVASVSLSKQILKLGNDGGDQSPPPSTSVPTQTLENKSKWRKSLQFHNRVFPFRKITAKEKSLGLVVIFKVVFFFFGSEHLDFRQILYPLSHQRSPLDFLNPSNNLVICTKTGSEIWFHYTTGCQGPRVVTPILTGLCLLSCVNRSVIAELH